MNRGGALSPKALVWGGVLIAVLLLVAVAVTTRGGAGTPEESLPSTARPCEVLHAGEVKRLMNFPPETSVKGMPVHAVTHIGVPGMAECIWSPEKATGSLVVGVAVGLDREAFSKWKRASEQAGNVRAVGGLGEEAAWAGKLVVRAEGIVVGVDAQVSGDTPRTSSERSKVIARTILERLITNGVAEE